jgi:predicted NBD/HSP70 family sugar kinase
MALPEKATHQQTRAFNHRLVLRTIYDRHAVSRAEIARLTGLTRTSVSDLVGELLRNGLVVEVGPGQSSGGKQPILLEVAVEGRHLIGLDLAESAFTGAVVDLRGRIIRSLRLPLDGRDGQRAVDRVIELIEALRADSRHHLLGVGVGAPGLIDSDSGTVRWAVNLDWADLPLGPLLEERFGVPVVVANDSQAAALAELTFFRRPRPQNLVVVKIGRGIGAGIILGGQLFQGDGYGAGEIGHVAAARGGAQCHCGSQGCLETVASMRAMVERASELRPGLDEDGFIAAYRAGDEQVRAIAHEGAWYVGHTLAGLVGVLNVNHVLIVGPVAALGMEWLGDVRRMMRDGALQLLTRDTEVEYGHVSDDIVVLGASAMLMNHQLGLSLIR